MAAHGADEPFLRVDARALKGIAANAVTIGSAMTVTAYGPGNDGQEPVATRTVQGEAARPLSPTQLRGAVRADGALEIGWSYRSRGGFAWIDAVDVPVDADFAGYRVSVARGAVAAEFSVAEPALILGSAELASLGSGAITVSVRQAGAIGLSRPATITINA